MAGAELPDDVIGLGGESESILSMRCKKSAGRGCITSAGAGGSCGQTPGVGKLLLAQPESNAQPINSSNQFLFPILDPFLIVGRRRGIAGGNGMLYSARGLHLSRQLLGLRGLGSGRVSFSGNRPPFIPQPHQRGHGQR
nr:hypothetical protein [Chromobacterium sp. ASV5]